MSAALLVSVSGLSDEAGSLDRADDFVTELADRGVVASQLFAPGLARADTPVAAWMRTRRAAGDAIVLHGYDHSRDPLGTGRSLTRRAEFAALPRHEAMLRLTAARRALTAAMLRTDVFVPPRWLASAGTMAALREQGFALMADESGLHDLRSGRLVAARVLGFRAADLPAGRAGEAWRARTLVAGAVRAARRDLIVRINVRSKDLRYPSRVIAALAAIDAALALGARPRTYGHGGHDVPLTSVA